MQGEDKQPKWPGPAPEKVIEALIFVSDVPVRAEQIVEMFEGEENEAYGMTAELAQSLMEELVRKYQDPEHPFELKKIAGGFQFFTKSEFFPFLRHAMVLKNQKKLGRSSLETLAIVAYRQPVTRPELEFIRGVSCDYAIQKLLEKNLVEITGRSDAPGRPLLYGTTAFFMEYFGLNDISDMPKLQEFKVDEQQFQEQFQVYLEDKEDMAEPINEIRQGNQPDINPEDN